MTLPRFMIAAPASGSGKTLVTCGILQALVERGLKVASFKCGPDYIDPMFHSKVIGARSRNLDTFFCDDDTLRFLFRRTAETADISVIEGVMGFYDGIRAADIEGSSCDVSLKLSAPVVLLVNCKGASMSCVPVIKGFREFRENLIKGVILNNMSAGLFPDIKSTIESELGLKVIGYVPRLKDISLESRHLGLVMPDEIVLLRENLHRLAAVLEETLDIDALIGLAGTAPDVRGKEPEHGVLDRKVRIGLASDEAFCFTYEDNIQLLKDCGAEVVPFSPISDHSLPEGISGIVLSGGYPELHGEALASNLTMLTDIRSKILAGMPCMAECGGFMYLHERMEDHEGILRNMVGVIKGEVRNTGKLTRFGYVSLTSDDPGSVLAGGCRGHEFHYWDSDNCGISWKAVKTSGKEYRCGHENGSLAAGYPHLYYYSNPDVPYRFLLRCREFSERSDVETAHQRSGYCRYDHDDDKAQNEREQLFRVPVPVMERLWDHVAERDEHEDSHGEAERRSREVHVPCVQEEIRHDCREGRYDTEGHHILPGALPVLGHYQCGCERERYDPLVQT